MIRHYSKNGPLGISGKTKACGHLCNSLSGYNVDEEAQLMGQIKNGLDDKNIGKRL